MATSRSGRETIVSPCYLGPVPITNVLRTGRRDLAALTVSLDGGKGAAAALLDSYRFGPEIDLLAGGGAFPGPLFPVRLGFKGGEGCATFLGVLLALLLART